MDFKCEFSNYYITRETYKKILNKAGLIKLKTIPISCFSEKDDEKSFFSDYINYCPLTCFSAEKPGDDKSFLQLAIETACQNVSDLAGGPFGAVIVDMYRNI